MIYLDNAATTWPKPPQVVGAMAEAQRKYGANPGRGGHQMSMKAGEMVYDVREKAAAFFGCPSPERVAFTLNATMALNMALKGLLQPGDHVITSCVEHHAVSRPCAQLQQQGVLWSAAMVWAGDAQRTIREFERQLRPNTRLIVCNHASNVFGNVLPVAGIAQMAKRHGIPVLVDASQSAGHVPIHMERDGIAVLCAAGHKGLYGPQGTGLLINAAGLPMHTILEGGTGSLSAQMRQPDFWPDRMESGTVNMPGIVGLGEGISFVDNLGISTIAQYAGSLRRYLAQELQRLPDVRVFDLPGDNTGVLSFQVGHMDCEQVAENLNQADIAVRAGLHCAPMAHRWAGTLEQGTVRVSPGVYSTNRDVERLVQVVKAL